MTASKLKLFFSLLILSLFSLPVFSSPVEMVSVPVSIHIKFNNKCIVGQAGVTAYVSCAFSSGGPFPAAGKIIFPGGSIDAAFSGDTYFETRVRMLKGQVLVEFFDAYSDGKGETLAEEVKDYYSKNDIFFNFTYFGPKFNMKATGKPVQPLY